MDLQQRTDDLNNKFQKVSSPLEETLKNAPPGSRKVHANTLLSLARETISNYELAVQAHRAEQIQQIAWATRNLLELCVWSEYCAKSSHNAKRFHDDALRDLLGALQRMDNVSLLAPESSSQDLATLKTMMEEFKRQISEVAVRSGVPKLDSSYQSVGEVAKEPGGQQATAFNDVNVLLSKFVHPTALIVNEVLHPQWTVAMMNIFLELAAIYAEGSLANVARANL